MISVLIFILAVFFAVNMGGANFAASFAAPYGGKIITRLQAAMLFGIFVVLGAVLYGEKVSHTLGEEIVSPELITDPIIVVVFFSAGLSMYVANLMKIPQSTSFVTVAAIAGAGMSLGDLRTETILGMLPYWILLPILSFGITFFLAGFIYPPRKINFWVYQKYINQESKLRIFVLVSSCYNAFSVGTNNVANVAGPLLGYGGGSIIQLLLIFALAFGAGSLVFTGPIQTAGNRVVPLGLLTASMISFVSGTLMLIASTAGVPQSFVMLQMGALFAIASLKHGTSATFRNPLTLKTFYTWTINPVLTFFLAWGLGTFFKVV